MSGTFDGDGAKWLDRNVATTKVVQQQVEDESEKPNNKMLRDSWPSGNSTTLNVRLELLSGYIPPSRFGRHDRGS